MVSLHSKRTAILIDGGYYRVRCEALWGKKKASDRANEIYSYCMLHISEPADPRSLYRIFYYDCPPMTRKIKHPLTGNEVDFSSMPGTIWANTMFRHLSEKDNVAIRMGELGENNASYILKDNVMLDLLAERKTVQDLSEDDFRIEVKQKGVDMRIGLDVVSLAMGKHVDLIVLIAGDSDFVPVAKMARRNGITFILDPMKQRPKHSMIEHVDFVESYTDKIV